MPSGFVLVLIAIWLSCGMSCAFTKDSVPIGVAFIITIILCCGRCMMVV